jgi:hypothetical protein
MSTNPLEPTCAAFTAQLVAARTPPEARAAIDRSGAVLRPDAPGLPTSDGNEYVGIWRRTSVDGETSFVRDGHVPGARWWANVERIGPKRGKRVLLIGESCARGYPLDPLFNCASALDHYLRAAAPSEHVEVIDLAQLAMMPRTLLAVLRTVRLLEPDLCVIFAGNNWAVGLEHSNPTELSAAARDGWPAVRNYLEQVVRRRISEWVAELTRIVAQNGTPLLFVIPAENIWDYPVAAGLVNPLLPSDGQAVREELAAQVEALQRAARFEECERIAAELVALEDGCSIAGLQALARCARARGAIDEAARLVEQARELLVGFPGHGMSSYVARTEELRRGLATAGVPTIDLPRRFAIENGSPLLGREWFYDDCHMTSKGVLAAMKAVAEAALAPLGLGASGDRLGDVDPSVSARAEAQAACAAALLNSHDERIVRAYLARSLALLPEVAGVWRQYLAMRLRRTSLVLCPAFHRLRELEDRFPFIGNLDRALTDGVRPVYTRDARVARVIAEAIAPNDPDAPARCEKLLRRKYEAVHGTADVLAADVSDTTFLGRFAIELRRAYVPCLQRRVRFHLMGDPCVRRWRFQLTARVARVAASGGMAELHVNGERVAAWTASREWTTVDGMYESTGRNRDGDELMIVWPEPGETRADRIDHVSAALENRFTGVHFLANLYTVWGEIQTFAVEACVPELEAMASAMAVG